MCVFSLIDSETSNGRVNEQVKRAFKSYFFRHQKKTKKQSIQVLLEIFFKFQHKCVEVPISSVSKSKSPFFFLFIFFEECLNPQFMINKTANEHTVDYHPSPSELTSWINLLIFRWTPKRFISLEYFLNFFSKLYIPPWLRKSFKFNNH